MGGKSRFNVVELMRYTFLKGRGSVVIGTTLPDSDPSKA